MIQSSTGCRRTTRTIVLFFVAASLLFSQSDSKIQYFRGGHVEVQSQLSLAGPGPVLKHATSDTPGLHLNPAHNPVFLITDPGKGISIQAGLPVSLNLSALAGIDARVETGMDNALAPYEDEEASISYPLVDARYKTTTPIQKVELTIKKRQYHLGAVWEGLVGASNRSRMVGMELRASTPTESGSGPSDVILNARFNGFFDYDMRLQRAGAILAFPLTDNINIGVQVSRLFAHFRTEGRAFIDATMLYSGSEYAFNDPNALWPNSLDQSIKGNYSGQSMQYRLGFSRHGEKSVWEFMMDTGAFLQCRGDLTLQQNTIPAFQIDALMENDEDAEILDASLLNLSQLTRTERIENTTYDKIRLALPATFQLGYMRWSGAFLWHVGVAAFYGGYAIKYGPSGVYLNPGFKTSITCQYKSWFMHIDAMFVKSRIVEIPTIASQNVSTVLPRFAFGRHFQIKQWRFYPTLQVSPNPSIQTGIQLEI